MYKLIKGDIFDQAVDALVNPVNCKGVMGAGLAKQFKIKYSDNYTAYKNVCDKRLLTVGAVHVYTFKPTESLLPRYIINFPTKIHWKHPSRLEIIEEGLEALVLAIDSYSIESLAMPQIGCGLGGLDWEDVGPLVEQTFEGIDIDLRVIYL